MIFNKEQVKKYLPHRDPFLFVDEITKINLTDQIKLIPIKDRKPQDLVGSGTEGLVCVKDSHPIFAGHFPGNPILPGVVQVETMAQISSFLFTSLKEEEIGSYAIDVALLGIDKARFKHVIRPNEKLRVITKMIKIRNWFLVFEGAIFIDEKKCSECEFMASLKFVN